MNALLDLILMALLSLHLVSKGSCNKDTYEQSNKSATERLLQTGETENAVATITKFALVSSVTYDTLATFDAGSEVVYNVHPSSGNPPSVSNAWSLVAITDNDAALAQPAQIKFKLAQFPKFSNNEGVAPYAACGDTNIDEYRRCWFLKLNKSPRRIVASVLDDNDKITSQASITISFVNEGVPTHTPVATPPPVNMPVSCEGGDNKAFTRNRQLRNEIDKYSEAMNAGLSYVETTEFGHLYGPIECWNTGSVKDFSVAFASKDTLNPDISGWDVSSATDLSNMFFNAHAFNQDLRNWNTSSFKDFGGIFHSASSFNGDISTWDVSSATNLQFLFTDAKAFNNDLSMWNVSSVTRFVYAFSGATAFNSDISNWDVSSVDQFSGIFSGATSFNQDISGWDTGRVVFMSDMFAGATSFNQDISMWNVSSIGFTTNMFQNAASFNHNLCPWIDGINSKSLDIYCFYAADMFVGSDCVNQGSPQEVNGFLEVQGPMCASC